jgi:nitrate/TMAO reductase-like tetraheme cytochrome c subunit
MPTGVVWAVLAVALVVAGLVATRPAITVGRGGKILAFLGFFIFPVFAGLLGLDYHVERSKQTQFCLSCHVMEAYGRSLHIDDKSYIPAAHYQNNRVPREEACYTCHTDYTLYTGGIKAKMRGLHHVYVQYLGKPAQPIHLYQPYNNRECLHCHQGARSFEEGATHSAVMDDIKSNQLSCVSSGCHDMVHNVAGHQQLKYWSPKP